MTAQAQEGLRFRGKDYGMAACPLDQAFDAVVRRPPFVWEHTACWRGYIGAWEVRDDRLYLTGLDARVPADADPEVRRTRDFTLAELFPDASPDGVFAHWVTDWLRVPDGELLEYVHMGFGSSFERDIQLAVHRGRLLAVGEVDNRTNAARPLQFTPRLDEVYGDEAAFLRAIHAHPCNAVTKLVYADWLDERGDPRGELLRLDAELATATDDTRGPLLTDRERVLRTVKDWFWMKLADCPVPRSNYGWELRDW